MGPRGPKKCFLAYFQRLKEPNLGPTGTFRTVSYKLFSETERLERQKEGQGTAPDSLPLPLPLHKASLQSRLMCSDKNRISLTMSDSRLMGLSNHTSGFPRTPLLGFSVNRGNSPLWGGSLNIRCVSTCPRVVTNGFGYRFLP